MINEMNLSPQPDQFTYEDCEVTIAVKSLVTGKTTLIEVPVARMINLSVDEDREEIMSDEILAPVTSMGTGIYDVTLSFRTTTNLSNDEPVFTATYL